MITVVHRGDEILLAHNRSMAAGYFALIAGFVEPGETMEEAVRREVREEVKLEVGDPVYQSSQPWPFPSQLMAGSSRPTDRARSRWTTSRSATRPGSTATTFPTPRTGPRRTRSRVASSSAGWNRARCR